MAILKIVAPEGIVKRRSFRLSSASPLSLFGTDSCFTVRVTTSRFFPEVLGVLCGSMSDAAATRIRIPRRAPTPVRTMRLSLCLGTRLGTSRMMVFWFGPRCSNSSVGFLLCELNFRSNSEIAGHCLDYIRGNYFLRFRIGGEQGIIADDVHQPGNTLRIGRDLLNRITMKQAFPLIARGSKPKIDIRSHFLGLERIQPTSKGYPLFKLAESRLFKFCLKLGLAHQHNLE